MYPFVVSFGALIILTILIFFISRYNINNLFHFFRIFIHNEKTVSIIVSIIFLPGTIIHEFSHFFAAMILFLKVRDVRIFPEWEKEYIKLGRVQYEKRDFLRSILVGIAPFFGGLLFFFFLSFYKLFPQANIFIDALLIYIIYSVSSNMFSSAQDLVDIALIVPIFALIGVIVYVFNVRIDILLTKRVQESILIILYPINLYFLYSFVINLCLAIGLTLIIQGHRRFKRY